METASAASAICDVAVGYLEALDCASALPKHDLLLSMAPLLAQSLRQRGMAPDKAMKVAASLVDVAAGYLEVSNPLASAWDAKHASNHAATSSALDALSAFSPKTGGSNGTPALNPFSVGDSYLPMLPAISFAGFGNGLLGLSQQELPMQGALAHAADRPDSGLSSTSSTSDPQVLSTPEVSCIDTVLSSLNGLGDELDCSDADALFRGLSHSGARSGSSSGDSSARISPQPAAGAAAAVGGSRQAMASAVFRPVAALEGSSGAAAGSNSSAGGAGGAGSAGQGPSSGNLWVPPGAAGAGASASSFRPSASGGLGLLNPVAAEFTPSPAAGSAAGAAALPVSQSATLGTAILGQVPAMPTGSGMIAPVLPNLVAVSAVPAVALGGAALAMSSALTTAGATAAQPVAQRVLSSAPAAGPEQAGAAVRLQAQPSTSPAKSTAPSTAAAPAAQAGKAPTGPTAGHTPSKPAWAAVVAKQGASGAGAGAAAGGSSPTKVSTGAGHATPSSSPAAATTAATAHADEAGSETSGASAHAAILAAADHGHGVGAGQAGSLTQHGTTEAGGTAAGPALPASSTGADDHRVEAPRPDTARVEASNTAKATSSAGGVGKKGKKGLDNTPVAVAGAGKGTTGAGASSIAATGSVAPSPPSKDKDTGKEANHHASNASGSHANSAAASHAGKESAGAAKGTSSAGGSTGTKDEGGWTVVRQGVSAESSALGAAAAAATAIVLTSEPTPGPAVMGSAAAAASSASSASTDAPAKSQEGSTSSNSPAKEAPAKDTAAAAAAGAGAKPVTKVGTKAGAANAGGNTGNTGPVSARTHGSARELSFELLDVEATLGALVKRDSNATAGGAAAAGSGTVAPPASGATVAVTDDGAGVQLHVAVEELTNQGYGLVPSRFITRGNGKSKASKAAAANAEPVFMPDHQAFGVFLDRWIELLRKVAAFPSKHEGELSTLGLVRVVHTGPQPGSGQASEAAGSAGSEGAKKGSTSSSAALATLSKGSATQQAGSTTTGQAQASLSDVALYSSRANLAQCLWNALPPYLRAKVRYSAEQAEPDEKSPLTASFLHAITVAHVDVVLSALHALKGNCDYAKLDLSRWEKLTYEAYSDGASSAAAQKAMRDFLQPWQKLFAAAQAAGNWPHSWHDRVREAVAGMINAFVQAVPDTDTSPLRRMASGAPLPLSTAWPPVKHKLLRGNLELEAPRNLPKWIPKDIMDAAEADRVVKFHAHIQEPSSEPYFGRDRALRPLAAYIYWSLPEEMHARAPGAAAAAAGAASTALARTTPHRCFWRMKPCDPPVNVQACLTINRWDVGELDSSAGTTKGWSATVSEGTVEGSKRVILRVGGPLDKDEGLVALAAHFTSVTQQPQAELVRVTGTGENKNFGGRYKLAGFSHPPTGLLWISIIPVKEAPHKAGIAPALSAMAKETGGFVPANARQAEELVKATWSASIALTQRKCEDYRALENVLARQIRTYHALAPSAVHGLGSSYFHRVCMPALTGTLVKIRCNTAGRDHILSGTVYQPAASEADADATIRRYCSAWEACGVLQEVLPGEPSAQVLQHYDDIRAGFWRPFADCLPCEMEDAITTVGPSLIRWKRRIEAVPHDDVEPLEDFAVAPPPMPSANLLPSLRLVKHWIEAVQALHMYIKCVVRRMRGAVATVDRMRDRQDEAQTCVDVVEIRDPRKAASEGERTNAMLMRHTLQVLCDTIYPRDMDVLREEQTWLWGVVQWAAPGLDEQLLTALKASCNGNDLQAALGDFIGLPETLEAFRTVVSQQA